LLDKFLILKLQDKRIKTWLKKES